MASLSELSVLKLGRADGPDPPGVVNVTLPETSGVEMRIVAGVETGER